MNGAEEGNNRYKAKSRQRQPRDILFDDNRGSGQDIFRPRDTAELKAMLSKEVLESFDYLQW